MLADAVVVLAPQAQPVALLCAADLQRANDEIEQLKAAYRTKSMCVRPQQQLLHTTNAPPLLTAPSLAPRASQANEDP